MNKSIIKSIVSVLAVVGVSACGNLDLTSGISTTSSVARKLQSDIGISSIPSDNIAKDARIVADLGFKVFKFWPKSHEILNDSLRPVFENAELEVLVIMPPPDLGFEATARFIMSNYDVNKTIIFTNWESDWVLNKGAKCFWNPDCNVPTDRVDELAAKFSADQTSINTVRAEFPDSKLQIYYAVEVNLPILAAKKGKPSVTTDVLPLMYPKPDFVSYSAWENFSAELSVKGSTAQQEFLSALDLIANNVGHRNIFLGEMGYGAESANQRPATVRSTVELGRSWGAKYFVYWNLYGNWELTPAIYEALHD